jgi:hypothetical protein
LLIARQAPFNSLHDNDQEGNEYRNLCLKHFGSAYEKCFKLLPLKGKAKKQILQDLFEGSDLVLIRSELGIPTNTSFERTILALFYSNKKESILKKLSQETKDAFIGVLSDLDFSVFGE